MLLEESKDKIKGGIVDNHITLDIVEKDFHFWSPQLIFRVEKDEYIANQSILFGLIGPRPVVWSMFMFIYCSIGSLGFFITCFGVSSLLLGSFSYLILAFPITILFMLTAYKAGKYGEQLGKDQVELLKQFVRAAIAIQD